MKKYSAYVKVNTKFCQISLSNNYFNLVIDYTIYTNSLIFYFYFNRDYHLLRPSVLPILFPTPPCSDHIVFPMLSRPGEEFEKFYHFFLVENGASNYHLLKYTKTIISAVIKRLIKCRLRRLKKTILKEKLH